MDPVDPFIKYEILRLVWKYGKYYSSTALRTYSDGDLDSSSTSSDNIICDDCCRNNLKCCIGFDRYNLCLQCAELYCEEENKNVNPTRYCGNNRNTTSSDYTYANRNDDYTPLNAVPIHRAPNVKNVYIPPNTSATSMPPSESEGVFIRENEPTPPGPVKKNKNRKNEKPPLSPYMSSNNYDELPNAAYASGSTSNPFSKNQNNPDDASAESGDSYQNLLSSILMSPGTQSVLKAILNHKRT